MTKAWVVLAKFMKSPFTIKISSGTPAGSGKAGPLLPAGRIGDYVSDGLEGWAGRSMPPQKI